MKILLVTPINLPDSFKRFLATLRTDVGTCEHLCLDHTLPLTAQKKLFESYLFSMFFDRHVLCYQDAEVLNTRLQFCTGLRELTLLSLQPEQPEQRKVVESFAITMPWMRWAGSDEYSFSTYQSNGIDAHLLPPMAAASAWIGQPPTPSRAARCHVLGDCSAQYAVRLPDKDNFYDFPHRDISLLEYVKQSVSYGDIVLVQESHFLERHVVAEIMATGALIVVPSEVMAFSQIDVSTRSAFVSVDSTDEIASLFAQIDSPTFDELLSRSLIKAQSFSPESVARALGRLLMQTGRDRATFQARSGWL